MQGVTALARAGVVSYDPQAKFCHSLFVFFYSPLAQVFSFLKDYTRNQRRI